MILATDWGQKSFVVVWDALKLLANAAAVVSWKAPRKTSKNLGQNQPPRTATN